MARNATALTEENADVTVDTGQQNGGKRKRRASGPRQSKPYHVLFRITDASGNEIPDAQFQTILTSKDTTKLLEAMDQNPGAKRMVLTA